MRATGALLILGGIAAGARAEDARRVDLLLAQGDIVLSEEAVGGAEIELIEEPAEIEAGRPPALRQAIREFRQQNRGSMTRREFQKALQKFIAEWKEQNQGGGNGGGAGGGQGSASTGIQNGEFGTDLAGWKAMNAYGGVSSFGSVVAAPASNDGKFAVIHTGPGADFGQGFIEQNFALPKSTSGVFSTLYNFVTTEWSMSGKGFNDYATITLTSSTGSVHFSLTESVHGSNFVPATDLPQVMNGGAGQDGGQTGWKLGSSGSLFFDQGAFTVRIEVNDAGDWYADSAILVDRVGIQ